MWRPPSLRITVAASRCQLHPLAHIGRFDALAAKDRPAYHAIVLYHMTGQQRSFELSVLFVSVECHEDSCITSVSLLIYDIYIITMHLVLM